MDTAQIVRDLKTQEAALQNELGKVQSALSVLENEGGARLAKAVQVIVRPDGKGLKQVKRKLSAAGRAAISRAAKKRWAAVRAAKKKAGK